MAWKRSHSNAALRLDWVLMDVRMPRLNRIQATRQIKALFPAARILIVTSFDEVRLREAAQQAGACGYVLKENLSDLRQLLTRCTEENQHP